MWRVWVWSLAGELDPTCCMMRQTNKVIELSILPLGDSCISYIFLHFLGVEISLSGKKYSIQGCKYSESWILQILLSVVVQSQSCPTLWDPMDCSTPGFLVLHYLPEFAQTHVHCCLWVHVILGAAPQTSPADILLTRRITWILLFFHIYCQCYLELWSC